MIAKAQIPSPMAGIVVPLLSSMIGEAIFGVIGGDQSTKEVHRKPSVLSHSYTARRPGGKLNKCHTQANDDVNTRISGAKRWLAASPLCTRRSLTSNFLAWQTPTVRAFNGYISAAKSRQSVTIP
jgi:hypothetical protein